MRAHVDEPEMAFEQRRAGQNSDAEGAQVPRLGPDAKVPMKATIWRPVRKRRPGSTFVSLRVRNYRIYACGALISNIGTWMQRVGQDWLVWQLTGSAAAVGIATMAQLLPALFLSYPGGIVADRFDRRNTLLAYQMHMALPSALIGALAITSSLSHVVLLSLILWFGCATAIEAPLRHSFVADLVPNGLLPNAVGLNSASYNSAQLIGPAIGGLLIAALGSGVEAAGWVILVNCLSFAVAALALWALNRAEFVNRTVADPHPAESGSGPPQKPDAAPPDIAAILLLLLVVGVFGLVFRANNVLMTTIVFAEGATVFGVLGSLLAVGSLCGAVYSARHQVITVRYLAVMATALALANLAAAWAPTLVIYALVLPFLGYLSQTSTNPGIALLQVLVRDDRRGRVSAIAMTCLIGGNALSATAFGFIAEATTPRISLLVGGLGALVGAVCIYCWYRLRSRRVDQETDI
jgi:MFS family permease